MTQAPIFIGGVFRSGTTLLRAMLAQHSAIASGLETYWFECDPRQRHDAAFNDRMEKWSVFFEVPRKTIDGFAADAASTAQLLDLFMAEVARHQGKPRWAEKTPGNVAHMAHILDYWPDAKILHIVRDPKDVFASLHGGGKSGGPSGFAEIWCGIVGKARRDAASMDIVGKSYLELRYETLVNAPEQTMRQVLDFIGATWEPKVAQFAGKQDDFDKVLAVTGKSSTTLEALRLPLNQGKIGAWARIVTPQEIAEVRREVTARGFGEMFAADEAASEAIIRSA
ncbi:MAG: sulfotransferase [Rhodospirillales bacterium]